MKRILLYCFACFLVLSCSDNDNSKDMEKPSIDMTRESAFPKNCVILYRGETFSFKAIFTDNAELGNYNIEIHNNFDHHSHSTDDVECEPEPKKKPVNPWVYNQDFPIPPGKTSFEADNTISMPAGVDTGDYHFMVRLTDNAGWQQLKAISIKITNRE